MSRVWIRAALAAALFAFAGQLLAAETTSKWSGEVLACAKCHRKITESFRPTPHGKAMEFGAEAMTCTSCHAGDTAAHMKSMGKEALRNPGTMQPEAGAETCLQCHTNSKNMMFWKGSSHQTAQVACNSCHSVHSPNAKGQLLTKVTETETCTSCHIGVRKAKMQRSTHLIRDERGVGRMECSACHNPHGSQTEKLIAANHVNEKCYECHQDKRGPLLFEHAPVRENCQSCHTAHGSNNTSLLTARVPMLCQQCHVQPRHGTNSMTPTSFFNVGRSCGQCHSQIHGTNHPSGVYFMR